jgi:hypothetical protein
MINQDGRTQTFDLGSDACRVEKTPLLSDYETTRSLVIRCREGGQSVWVDIVPLGDPRSLGVGTQFWARDLHAVKAYTTWDSKHADTQKAHGDLTVNVTEAVGSSSPLPDVVTADYLRRFRVHSEAVAEGQSEPIVTVDFAAEQTAADLEKDLDARHLCL